LLGRRHFAESTGDLEADAAPIDGVLKLGGELRPQKTPLADPGRSSSEEFRDLSRREPIILAKRKDDPRLVER